MEWSAKTGVQGVECRDLSAGTGVHGVECRDWSAKTGVQGLQCMDCSEGNQKGPLKNLQQLKHVSARTADPSMREEATGVERLQNLCVEAERRGNYVLANSTAPLAVLVLHSFWFNCALGSFYFRNFAVQFVYWWSQFQYLFVELGS